MPRAAADKSGLLVGEYGLVVEPGAGLPAAVVLYQRFCRLSAFLVPVVLSRFAPVLLLHTLIWSVVGLILSIPPPGQPSPLPGVFWLKQAAVLGLLVVAFYANVHWAVPRLLYRRQVLAYLGVGAAVAGAVLWAHWRLDAELEVPRRLSEARHAAFSARDWPAPGPPGPPRPPNSFRPGGPHGPGAPGRPPGPPGPEGEARFFNLWILLTTLFVLGVSTSVAAVQKSQRDEHTRQLLEQARLATELSLLKAQINPHFFFNTLNNIYSLTFIDGTQARTALHRLSRMMRYVLYETPAQTALLSHEVTFLRDYIDLMHLRLTEEVSVALDLPETLQEAAIAPMLLLPFVENAFKHGVRAGSPSRIQVALRQSEAEPNMVEFEVCNSVFAERPGSLEAGGIGLTNTRRRLELLYAGRYHLMVQEQTPAGEYRVLLTLQL
ncbi:sensor histidine kinase [Hymenobacter sublimis]|uniref:Histidine kinase n=1 Tax=Hymenobacter sublimis TaxID=2933777 RepID=A0ABY4JBR9_9BACT|nr:histidine kinase [Hymenobacter sublimis]UPL50259.1 histidine kinase [Hymenobacter sublimis]